jgi:hypothetical protein
MSDGTDGSGIKLGDRVSARIIGARAENPPDAAVGPP